MSQNVIVNVNGIQTEFRRAPGTRPVVGDYVVIDNAWMAHGEYSNGDVLIVSNVFSSTFLFVKKLDGTKLSTGLVPREYTVLQPTNIIVVDGKRYTKLDIQPRTGDKVLITGNGGEHHNLVIGSIGTVQYGGSTCSVIGKHTYGGTIDQLVYDRHLQVVVPLPERGWSSAPSATLSTGIPTSSNPLEKRVAELESQVSTLQSEVDVLKRKTTITVSAPTITLSRDRIVADAIADWKRLVEIGADFRQELDKGPFKDRFYHVSNVMVDSPSGFVTVTVRDGRDASRAGSIVKTSTAKTLPGEVFNEHIGKIIALYRALGLDVPAKYLKVPAPVGRKVGDIVEVDWSIGVKKRLKLVNVLSTEIKFDVECHVESNFGTTGRLVDDSARYTI